MCVCVCVVKYAGKNRSVYEIKKATLYFRNACTFISG
jgi:hypothetical protein